MVLTAVQPAPAQDPPTVTPKQIKQMQKLQEGAESMGSWDSHYQVLEQATDNVFQQHGWDSEPDRYARELVRQVGRISPFKPYERSEAFLDGVQTRWGLTQNQRTDLNTQMQREAMQVGMKHFRNTLPVAIEVMATRARGEPFTAEQVQRWSRVLKPLMDDSLRSVERITGQLAKSMTPEQRRLLETDMKALLHRHRDMEKQVEQWQAGNWNPTDWGLQDDPIHAAAMADYLRSEAEKNRAVQDALDRTKGLDESKIATDESEWDRYVRLFCDRYQCTDAQRTTASAILKDSKKEAVNYRAAHRDLIEKYLRLSESAETETLRTGYAGALEKELAPIAAKFERLKLRLHGQLLTSKQQRMFAQPLAKKASP